MLRKFLVWVTCIIMDFLVVFYNPDSETGEMFFKMYLTLTVVMYICATVDLAMNEVNINDDKEYYELENNRIMAKWDICFVAIMLMICSIVSDILNLDKYLMFKTMTFGYCLNSRAPIRYLSRPEIEDDDAIEDEEQTDDVNTNPKQ